MMEKYIEHKGLYVIGIDGKDVSFIEQEISIES